MLNEIFPARVCSTGRSSERFAKDGKVNARIAAGLRVRVANMINEALRRAGARSDNSVPAIQCRQLNAGLGL
jgi:hypothetical protein